MNQNPEIEKLNKKAKEYSKMLQRHSRRNEHCGDENLILALATQGHPLNH